MPSPIMSTVTAFRSTVVTSSSDLPKRADNQASFNKYLLLGHESKGFVAHKHTILRTIDHFAGILFDRCGLTVVRTKQ